MKEPEKQKFLGDNLKYARILNGLTLAEVGEKASVSRQFVQKLESGSYTTPTEELVSVFSEVLSVEPDFFFNPLQGIIQEAECKFRKRKTTPNYVCEKAITFGIIWNQIVAFLEREFDLPTIDFPVIEASNRKEIESAAEQCRVLWDLSVDSPIHSMVRCLERYGAIVTTFGEVSEKVDAFSYIKGRPIVVRNTAKESRSRARFDLAHELGHIVLHQGVDGLEDHLIEEQANHFASAFLMPRTGIIREFPRNHYINWEELIKMKVRWGVSLQALIRRAYDLRIIGAVQYRNANISISRRGWKKHEPAEQLISDEKPEVVPSCLEILEQSGFDSNDIAKKINLSASIFEKFSLPKISQEKLLEFDNVIKLDLSKGQKAIS